MERHIDEELEQIRDKLLLMGGKVEEMIRSANAALVQRDETFIARVKELEKEVDQLELEIDEDCLTLLARQQPMATDLRFLVAVMKITNDLERIGDVAHGIAKLVKPLNQEPPLKPYIDLPRMAEDASSMVRDCLDALVKQDGALAREVIGRDEKVDEIYKQLSRELFTFMIDITNRHDGIINVCECILPSFAVISTRRAFVNVPDLCAQT